MDWFTIIIGGVLLLLFAIYQYLTNKRGYLETLPWPLIKPGLLLGSPPYDLHNYYGEQLQVMLREKYGYTYTKYDGRSAMIVTIDPEIIKEVLIKQFENFTDITDFNFPDKHMSLDIAKGEQWRELRKELSPTFTSGKLKSMMAPGDLISGELRNTAYYPDGRAMYSLYYFWVVGKVVRNCFWVVRNRSIKSMSKEKCSREAS